MFRGSLDGGLDLVPVTHVAHHRERIATLRRGPREHVGLDPGKHHAGPALVEALGGGRPDPARRAGDQDAATGQIDGHTISPGRWNTISGMRHVGETRSTNLRPSATSLVRSISSAGTLSLM
jgi:hypothetical protein